MIRVGEPFPILIKAVKILTFGNPTLTQKGFQYVFAGTPIRQT
jgi:hypothetical protein